MSMGSPRKMQEVSRAPRIPWIVTVDVLQMDRRKSRAAVSAEGLSRGGGMSYTCGKACGCSQNSALFPLLILACTIG